MKKLLKTLLTTSVCGAMAFTAVQASAAVNYGEALQKSIYFYEAQQAGKLPAWNRVEWRGDSVLADGSDVGVDLSGGWFDAGDHVKFGFPMASTATMLAWGVLENPQAYENSGQMVHIRNNLRFVADYFMSAHTAPNELYGQVGTGSDDHAWWGSPEVVHLTSRAASNRPSYKIDASCPGSDLAGETAAALAAISMVFADVDPSYSANALTHARELHSFAHNYQGKYSDCITDATSFYNSWSGYNDELVWSSIWLHQATGEQSYLDAAVSDYANLNTEPQKPIKSYKWTHAWDDKGYGSYVLMAKLTGNAEYQADAERWLDYWSVGYEGDRVPYTAGGLAQLDTWGATRYAANTSFIALVYSDYLRQQDPSSSKAQAYYDFAVGQMEYIMGDNPNGIPYQIGMAADGPKNPHHRGAHGTWADSLDTPVDSRHLLIGALVGGPGSGDAYADDRGDYIANEVATDYNAGFTSALARLYLDFGGDPIPESQFPPAEQRGREFFVEAKINASGPRHVEIAAKTYNQSAWPARNSDGMKFRYFVDLTEEFAAGYTVADITVSTAYNQAKSVSQLQSWGDPNDNIYYTEVDFTGIDVFPGGQSDHRKEVQFRISLPTNSNASEWINEGDPSWDNYTSAAKPADRIPLYNAGELVWGSEPSPGCGASTGINCAPEVTDVSGTTLESTPVQVTLVGTDSDGVIASYQVGNPANGSATLSGDQLTYTPNAGFSGTDTFSYTATDNDGAVSSAANIVITVEELPVPAVSILSPAPMTEFVRNTNVTLNFSYNNAASVRIDSSDGSVATGVTANSYTYVLPDRVGSYSVDIYAQDEQGNDLEASDQLTLVLVDEKLNTPPEASFVASVNGLTVSVDASASRDADGDALTYSWDFDGVQKSGLATTHSFDQAGTYTVALTVSDGVDSDTVTQQVTVEEITPTGNCSFNIDNEWNEGFVATIRISNNGTAPINGWTVSWAFPSDVSMSHGWNAVFSGSNPYSASALSWNSTIQPGQSVEFGLVGAKPMNTDAPQVTITGDACQ